MPKTQVRQFLGLVNFYRRFILNHSKIAVPLNNLFQKGKEFIWAKECQNSFEQLRNALVSDPILALPDMTKPFILTCDASGSAIGYFPG